jgi:hypothetical protein
MNPRRCFCIEQMNRKLKVRGTMLVATFAIASPYRAVSRVKIETMLASDPTDEETGKRRRRPIGLFAEFCPFCGRKYPDPVPVTKKAKDELARARNPTYFYLQEFTDGSSRLHRNAQTKDRKSRLRSQRRVTRDEAVRLVGSANVRKLESKVTSEEIIHHGS